MTKDLPDFQSEVVSAAVEATSFRSGLDADKPASPAAGDIWLARDTLILYICAVAGAWTGFDAAQLVQGTLTLYADLAGGGYELENIADPTAAQSAATRAYILAQLANYLALTGGTMAGAIAMGTNKITGLDAPTAAADAARKTDVDTVDAKLDDISHSEPARAVDAIYRNGTKIRIVTATIMDNGTAHWHYHVRIGTTSPPSIYLCEADGDTDYNVDECTFTFVVPPNYYYMIYEGVGGTSGAVEEWHEFDLH